MQHVRFITGVFLTSAGNKVRVPFVFKDRKKADDIARQHGWTFKAWAG